ncbi:type II toxin-antitoxin system ParD family antitoxin [Polymorphobacter sp. PAMC 29334]|uniref:type II toxin-antitoxin system ParD family antitoxin n=1 Tax=Polymorphobacter sp. PAMC 29334 TaxID=2862331 RepID=UPI001D023BD4|nr:type II toxin-antitoxin system ParD family antitoxin [Polymorphobacter sp. PAMC 29334]
MRSRVATGEYDSPSEVIQDDLEALIESGPRVEKWLRDKVTPAYDRYKADPMKCVPIDVAVEELAERHVQATAGM